MRWVVWFWVLLPLVLLLFVAVFGPNKVKGKRWRGWQKPSVMMGPEKRDPPESRRN